MASGRIESIDSPHGQRLEDKINAQRKMANEKLRELVPRSKQERTRPVRIG